jgi:hypothetical protein
MMENLIERKPGRRGWLVVAARRQADPDEELWYRRLPVQHRNDFSAGRNLGEVGQRARRQRGDCGILQNRRKRFTAPQDAVVGVVTLTTPQPWPAPRRFPSVARDAA